MNNEMKVVDADQLKSLIGATYRSVLYEVNSSDLTNNETFCVLSDGIIHWRNTGVIAPTIIWSQIPYDHISQIEVHDSSIRISHGGFTSLNKLEKAACHKFLQTMRGLKESGKIPNDLTLVDLLDSQASSTASTGWLSVSIYAISVR